MIDKIRLKDSLLKYIIKIYKEKNNTISEFKLLNEEFFYIIFTDLIKENKYSQDIENNYYFKKEDFKLIFLKFFEENDTSDYELFINLFNSYNIENCYISDLFLIFHLCLCSHFNYLDQFIYLFRNEVFEVLSKNKNTILKNDLILFFDLFINLKNIIIPENNEIEFSDFEKLIYNFLLKNNRRNYSNKFMTYNNIKINNNLSRNYSNTIFN